jgi:hypothetical protein
MAITSGKGFEVRIGDGEETEAFTLIPNITVNTGGFSPVWETEDITSHSTSGNAREFAKTLYAFNDLAFTFIYDESEATHVSLDAQSLLLTPNNYQIEYPDGTEKQFSGLVVGFEREAQVDATSKVACTIKVSGPMTAVV